MLRIRRHQRLFTIMYNVLSVAELVFFIVGLYIVDWQVRMSPGMVQVLAADSGTPLLRAQAIACGHATHHRYLATLLLQSEHSQPGTAQMQLMESHKSALVGRAALS